jgi:hypothetical protein
LAIVVNSPVTSVPIVAIALKAAIDTKKAIMAYSTAVAPLRSSLIRRNAIRMFKAVLIRCRRPIMPGKGLTIRENRRAERAKRQHDGFFIDIRGAVG